MSSSGAADPIELSPASGAGEITNGNGGCLDLPNGDTSNGAPLHIWDCNPTGVNQTWFIDGSGSIHYGPNPLKCVDLPGQDLDSNGNPINMTQLQLWDCNNATGPDQVWSVSGNQIQFAQHPDKCVELRDGSSANGTPVQVYDCNGTSGQTWYPGQNGPVQPVQLQNGNGACLDLPDGKAFNGAQLQLWHCDAGGLDQSWYLDGTNAIHYAGDPSKCVDFPAQGWTSGGFVDTPLQLWDCSGDSGRDQNIPLAGNHTLQIGGSPCVEARRGTFANGTVVQGSACKGTTGQTWYPRVVGQTDSCIRMSCESMRAECGTHDDGCGGTIDCNACPTGGTCNPAGRCLPPTKDDTPLGVNVCEKLIEQVVVAPTFQDVLTCRAPSLEGCFFTPDCCVPELCILNPSCTFLNSIQLTAEIIFHPGDIYCRATLTPGQYVERLFAGRLSDVGDLQALLTSGGLSAVLDFDTQVLAAAGSAAPDNVQNLIRTLTQPVYNGGDNGFAYSDMQDVKIVSSAFPTAGVFLPSGTLAITLGPVIVMDSGLYDALFSGSNARVSYSDFLTSAAVDKTFIHAVDTIIHEYVHAKQYRKLGQNEFFIQYLSQVANGGAQSFEQEAYAFEIGLSELQGGRWCSVMKSQDNALISKFSVPVAMNTCP